MLAITSLIAIGCSKNMGAVGKNPTIEQAWETTQELRVPESVMYDSKSGNVFVANINGKPTEKNGMGFIAVLSLDGTIQNLKWATGLNAPKGMGIMDRTLYVTDIDRVHAIDIATGSIKQTWEVEGARFLNDIAIGGDGAVYITDMLMGTIHVIRGGSLDTFLMFEYKRPNGLFISGHDLLVGTAEGLLKIDLQTKTVSVIIEHKGGIDGIKPIGGGRYVISDWKGKTQVIQSGKQPLVLLDTTAAKINAADFEYITDRNLILIPTFFDNRVVAYRLK